MRLGGRIQAAIEVLSDMDSRKRPTSEALKDWGLSHRFAGSGDRAAIGNIVYDALRQKSSTQYVMDSDKNRRLAIGTLLRQWGFSPASLAEALDGDKFAPDPLSAKEIEAFESRDIDSAEEHIQADVPQWLTPSLHANFAEDWVIEMQAMALRPSLDVRANTLKASQDKVLKSLAKQKANQTRIARQGVRIAPTTGPSRHPNVQAEPAFQKGWFDIQDEGSQIVADLIYAQPGEQVLDFCAGAGGKTLAMAATMENRGQIHAYDADKNRLKPIFERLKRAGVRNSQVHGPDDDLADLSGRMDRVVIDAPCTGTGTWRRRPDAKWKLTKETLEARLNDQEEVLSQAAPFVRPGGFLIYITCSVLPEENENQMARFVDDNPQFEMLSAGEAWQDLFGFDKPQPWSADMKSITLTPASTDTDGFFFSVLGRKDA